MAAPVGAWVYVRCRSADCRRVFAAEGGRELFRYRADVATIKLRGMLFVLSEPPALVVCRCGTVWRRSELDCELRLAELAARTG